MTKSFKTAGGRKFQRIGIGGAEAEIMDMKATNQNVTVMRAGKLFPRLIVRIDGKTVAEYSSTSERDIQALIRSVS